MGGPAVFSGSGFQARVGAYICVQILTQGHMGWFGLGDDTASALSLETGTAGDDIEVEFASGGVNGDVQAKHGLSGPAAIRDAIVGICKRSGDDNRITVLVTEQDVRRGALNRVKIDLERLSSGRSDGITDDTNTLIATPGVTHDLLSRICIMGLDVEEPSSPHTQAAVLRLESVLVDPQQAFTAFTILIERCGQLGARRLRLDRKAIVELLRVHQIRVNPPAKDFRWHRELDQARELLNQRHTSACATALDSVERAIATEDVEPRVWYRLFTLRAAHLHSQAKDREALEYARRALEIDEKGVHALAQAVSASVALGETASARSYANRATVFHPNDAVAWSASAQVSVAEGTEPEAPPPAVAGSKEYLRTMAELYMTIGDASRAIGITKQLLALGDRNEVVLFIQANALLATDSKLDPAKDSTVYADAERLTTEIIERLPEDRQLVHKAYILRATARRELGRPDEAAADMKRVYELAPSDVDAIRNDAQWSLRQSNLDRALEVLTQPAVSGDSMLLIMRAQTRALRDEDDAARLDVNAALAILSTAMEPEVVRMMAADVAFLINDMVLAERLIAELPHSEAKKDPRALRLRARFAVRSGDWEKGLELYHDAMGESEGANRDEVRMEAGRELHKAGRSQEAATVLDAFVSNSNEDGRRLLLRVLTEMRGYTRLQELLDEISASGPLPEWALAPAIDTALAREDVDEAVRYLLDLVERGKPTPYARLYLAHLLIERGRIQDAEPHITASLASGTLSPLEQMQAAKLLADAGNHSRALDEALLAYRRAPGDYRMHQGLIMVSLADRAGAVPTASVIGENTHVVLKRGASDEVRQYTILSRDPIDSSRFELTVSEAERAGLLGKKVGDEIAMNALGLLGGDWRVESIVPALLFFVQDAMLNYEVRFPLHPFIQGMRIGEQGDPAALAPLINSVHARREHVEKTIRLYQEKSLPLGVVAKMLGAGVPDVMDLLASSTTSVPLIVEWADKEGQEESRAAAIAARVVVLTRSALHTMSVINLLSELTRYELVAPRSLVNELQKEVREGERALEEGRKVLSAGTSGLQYHETPAGDPNLVTEVENAVQLLEWAQTNARIVSRSLERASAVDEQTEQAREWIGESAYDAWTMCQDEGWTLYADDIGLRRFLPPGSTARSFGTIGLVLALAEQGHIATHVRDTHLITLLAKSHFQMPVTSDLIAVAFGGGPEISQGLRVKVLQLLASPALALSEAAQIAAGAFKQLVGRSIRTTSIGTAAHLALQALATRWTPAEATGALMRASMEPLALLPNEMDEVRVACLGFRKKALLLE